jgi:hypothetical protein
MKYIFKTILIAHKLPLLIHKLVVINQSSIKNLRFTINKLMYLKVRLNKRHYDKYLYFEQP